MTTTPPTSPGKPSISDAMAKLWAKYLPEIERRIAVLEAAATALSSGTLSTELQQQAHADAHKLAGSLGTFGLHRGTELARQVELLLASTVAESDLANLSACTSELHSLIQNH